ncbi:MAG: aldehyde dehydrogenase family protein [Candidatus Neomarinimicrobiota bacterium]
MTLSCVNPVTNELLATLPEATDEEIESKVDVIRGGLEQWQEMGLRERARAITGARKHLVSRMDEMMDVVRSETGKTEFEGIIEIMTTSEMMRFVSRSGPSALSRERRRIGLLRTKRGYVHYHPYGVAGIISPWNYPLILLAGPAVQALIVGNGVLLKPSEFTPLTALKLKEIFDESGFPGDIFQVVVGAGEVGEKVVRSPRVDLICFTGSVEVGRKIGVACAEQLKPAILELGGKDSLIVLEDADIERAARATVWGGFHNAGQTCISVERVYVEESVAEPFIGRVKELAQEVRWGPGEAETDLGAMTTGFQAEKVRSQLADASEKGATFLVGGDSVKKLDGVYMGPVIAVDVDESMDLMRYETFGPVIAISTVRGAHEALERANSLDYGLNASIFTNDMRKARMMAGNIKAGNVCINDALSNYLCAELPFGGVGVSGIGRLQGIEGIRGFAQIKSVCEDRLGLKKEPWWFPVSHGVKKSFRAVVKLRNG